MTDPDLVFDMDPQNVRRVEEWIVSRWPGVSLVKEADGSRLTWALGPHGRGIESIVATESLTPRIRTVWLRTVTLPLNNTSIA